VAINQLKDVALRNARPRDKEYELKDGDGLVLRVKPNGHKAWMLRYTSPITKKQVREYLGTYPEMSLAEARAQRQSLRETIALGIDPKVSENQVNVGFKGEIPKTVGQLFAVWFDQEVLIARKSKGDHASIKGRYKNYIQPVMENLPLRAVQRGHVMQTIDIAKSRGSMRTANILRQNAAQMFRFAMVREWMDRDPTWGISRRQAGGADSERDRVLENEEIVLLRDILARPPKQTSHNYLSTKRTLPVRTELMLWWSLATLARPGEVASLRRVGAVNVNTRQWHITAEVAKNNKAHVIHLSDFALAVWARITTIMPDDGIYAFPGRAGGHVGNTEVTRRLSDRQTRPKPIKGRRNSSELDLPGGRWTQHDLRRTGATIMGEMGIAKEVIDLCLNHREAKKVTRTYQRQQMLPQRQAAFDALGAHLTTLLGDPKDWLPHARDDEFVLVR